MEQIQVAIDKVVNNDFNGCVSILKNNQVLFQKAYGYADLPNATPNEVDTKFATASAGKAFVAVGILKLVESGRLKLEDAIGNILDCDLKAIDPLITIKQLLTHTSGIPDYFDESVMDEYAELWQDYPNYKIRRNADLLPLFIDKPMMYPAGEKFQYNNTGYVVLAMIIEKLTGKPFDLFLHDVVFNPCGMLDTGYYELDRLPSKCAIAYIYDTVQEVYYTNIYSVDAKGTGAGGAFTTVLDVEKFWAGLLGGKLLSNQMVEDMMKPQYGAKLDVESSNDKETETGNDNESDNETESEYGYGFWLDKKEDGYYTPYFQGCDPGVSFISSFDRQTMVSTTIVSNFGSDVWQLKSDLDQLLAI